MINLSKPVITACILAAGDGKRLSKYYVPKQLVDLRGSPIITYCLAIYESLEIIDHIVLIVHDEHEARYRGLVEERHFKKVRKIVTGGALRQDSVYIGLCVSNPCDYVVIQNGVSIFTSPNLIESCIRKAMNRKAVTAFVPEEYSSFLFAGDKVDACVDRNSLGHVRDPQVFEYSLLMSLHERSRRDKKKPFTNDVLMAEDYGQDVFLVESHPYNFKITTDIDILVAEAVLHLRNDSLISS